ncbi:hypothetical protein ES707_10437 [subsurface metagenome]
MPQFSPGEVKTAIAPMSNPTGKGFSYSAELYLDVTKAASSGVISFYLAAGETRNISFPVTMPQAEGTYPVYLDVFVVGELVGAYQATEDVVIGRPTLDGKILSVKCKVRDSGEWQSPPFNLPGNESLEVKWRVRNDSNCQASFILGMIRYGEKHPYWGTITVLDPGQEADIIGSVVGGSPGESGSVTWYLAALPGAWEPNDYSVWYDAEVLDQVSAQFSFY